MSLYSILLVLHSYLRWAVVLAALLVLVRAFGGSGAKRSYGPLDARAGLALVALFDTQLLFGLLLYAVASPFTTIAFGNVALAMKTTPLRFWMVEHPFAMVVAAALLHFGRVRVRKAGDDAAKHRRTRLWVGLALFAVLVGIPWPGLPYGRPLVRAAMGLVL